MPKNLALIRTWLSSETHRQRVRNNRQNLQRGKFWSFTRKNVSQSAWISTEAGRWETFRPCLEKALSDLTSLCISFTGRLGWRPLGVPSNLSGSLILDEKCTKGGFLNFLPSSCHARRLEAAFREQALSWGRRNPNMQFLFSTKRRVFFCPSKTVTFPCWTSGSTVVLRASPHCSQSQPLVRKVAKSRMARQSQATRKDCVSKLQFPWTCKNKPFPWWPSLCGVAAARAG